MPLSVILRDKLRRLAISQTQVDYQALKLITKNPSLPFETRIEAQKALQRFPSYARPYSVRNRCIVHGKARGVMGGFKMNYMVFRERALAEKMFRFAFSKSSLIHGQNALASLHCSHALKKFYSTADATTFESIKMISSKTINALDEEFKYKEMTSVQKQVLELLPADFDLLVRAKTGTGKTLAFLIAALESALARREGKLLNGREIPIMIISPTRELALQIAEEARRLLASHRYRVGVAVGGTSRNASLKAFDYNRMDLLVATPGRLMDILNSSENARKKVENLDTMILDEADRLLEMGFREDIMKIASYLPKKKQTFMFSATISKDVQTVAQNLLLPGHKFVDTVPENEEPTHMKIKQTYVVSSYSKQIVLLHQVLRHHMHELKGGKIIVFFPTTKIVSFMSNIFSKLPGIDIIEMHSQLSQGQRERQADRFRKSTSSIMFTTDVSARGVDYPGVSLVVQMGAPSNRDSYIHRVGRTGRAGKEGEGILILTPFEEAFLKNVSGIPIKQDFRFETEPDSEIKTKFKEILGRISQDQLNDCYFAMLNYLVSGSNMKYSRDSLQAAGREIAVGLLGFETAPPLPSSILFRIGSGGKPFRRAQSSSLYGQYRHSLGDGNNGNNRSSVSFGGHRSNGFRDGSSGTGSYRSNSSSWNSGSSFGGDKRSSFGGDKRSSFGGDKRAIFGDRN